VTVAPTTAGDVRGVADAGVIRFAGIPYGAAPVGTERFGSPVPPEPWTRVRPALAAGPASIQGATPLLDALGIPRRPQSEDCLWLTVTTPAVDGAGRPVMVWVHGGGFVAGSAESPVWDARRLARRGDVVVVSVSYRLGALGFLHLGELDPSLASSGLNGVLDIAAALRWVCDNIDAFGGDAGNVTVFGASAGAKAIATLLTMPAAAGLVRRAILQSGAGHATVTTTEAAARTRRFCELAGCSTVDDLQALDPAAIRTAQAALGAEEAAASPPTWSRGFHPVVDGHHLPARPIDRAQEGELAAVEVLTGTTDEEWRLFSWAEPVPASDDEVVERFVDVLDDPRAGAQVYRRRLGSTAPPQALSDAMLTDLRYRMPMQRFADASVAAGNPTWIYRFGYRTPVADGALGSCHSLDVPFVFDNREGPITKLVGERSPDALAEVVQRSWVAFARHGDPNHDGIPTWAPQTEGSRPVLRLDEPTTMLDDPEPDELAVWDAVP
jgi:para-nitrobenzyl esterase